MWLPAPSHNGVLLFLPVVLLINNNPEIEHIREKPDQFSSHFLCRGLVAAIVFLILSKAKCQMLFSIWVNIVLLFSRYLFTHVTMLKTDNLDVTIVRGYVYAVKPVNKEN